MRMRHMVLLQCSRLRLLVTCLAIALSSDALAGQTRYHEKLSQEIDAPQTWTVQNCTDHDSDSLRDIIENPIKAKSGDTVDLSQLPTLCGMSDSTITLTTGQILVSQANLSLKGPPPGEGTVTISGGELYRVLAHPSAGTLSIDNLTIADGFYYSASGGAYGGCIDGAGGYLKLTHTRVDNCVAKASNSGQGIGGGISAFHGTVALISSTVSNCRLVPGGNGGGVAANHITAKYSSIVDNDAGHGKGGGLYAGLDLGVKGSTIARNWAEMGSAAWVFWSSSAIGNSTISGNTAHSCGAITVVNSDNFKLWNDTIFGNNDETAGCAAVTFFGNLPNSALGLQSSIVANNTSAGVSADIFIYPGHGTLSGQDNLAIATNFQPQPGVVTVSSDPKLGPLQNNGGPTPTHALLPESPARGMGNVLGLPAGVVSDQRGRGYPRTTGANAIADIGAFEFDSVFFADFDQN